MYTVPDLLIRHRGTAASERVAIVDGPRRVTYGDLLERSLSLAASFKDAGLARGDRVGIFLRRSVEAVVALFATHLAGGVAVVINEQIRGSQARYIIEHSEAALLATNLLAFAVGRSDRRPDGTYDHVARAEVLQVVTDVAFGLLIVEVVLGAIDGWVHRGEN